MPDIQKSRSSEPSPHLTTEDVQPTEPNEAPPVRRFYGEVTKTEDAPFAGGPHSETWTGEWVKGGDVEKVRLRPIMSNSLTRPFVGGLENTSNASFNGEGA